jgi:hypothetical protein
MVVMIRSRGARVGEASGFRSGVQSWGRCLLDLGAVHKHQSDFMTGRLGVRMVEEWVEVVER